jgi:multidrug resistance efflux pump
MPEKLKERIIEIRSEEIEEILGRTPTWILRRGVIVLTTIILVLLVASWLFRYPDIITAPVVITSFSPPVSVVARSSGKIVSFMVKNQQTVKPGDYLAILENPADTGEINKLRDFLYTIDKQSILLQDIEVSAKQFSLLGDLQQPYLNFTQAVMDFQHYESLSFNAKKIATLQQQISLTNSYIDKLKGQKSLQSMNLKLASNQFCRDSALYTQKVMTLAEYEKAEVQFISNKTAYKNSEMALSNSMIQVKQLEQQIIELRLTQEKETKQLTDDINNSYKTLKSQFNSWEMAYVLKSTTKGRVSIGNYWSVNQNVKAGDVIMTIIPDKKEKPFGKITLAMENSGKVKSGQKVNIKLSNFPHTEFGMLTGTVKSFSLVPDQGKYYVEIELTNELKTNYNKQLPFLQEMEGTAEIITDNMRLIERIIAPIRSLYEEQLSSE